MTVTVVPTLAVMAEVYALDTGGGPDSPRFQRYVAAGRDGVPVGQYNPMTSQPVADTVDHLLAIDAESVVEASAARVVERLGWTDSLVVQVVVATPGMWTDRVGTGVEAVLDRGRAHDVLFWCGDEPDVDAVAAEAAATAVRAGWWERRGAAGHTAEATLREIADREGLAGALAGRQGRTSPRAAEALAVLGDDTARSTAVAFLWGDRVATALGHPPIGLGPDEGIGHVIALARP